MNTTTIDIGFTDLVIPLANTVDMMSPALADHHLDVGYFALRIGEEMGFSQEEVVTLAVAGMLHDIGAFSLNERLDILEFEYHKPTQHCRAGYELLRHFEPFSQAAEIIRFHHLPWNNGEGNEHNGTPVPLGSHVIHLADRISVLVPKNIHALSKVPEICEAVEKRRGTWFHPELVDAVLAFANQDSIWMDVVSRSVERPLVACLKKSHRVATLDELLEFGKLVCRLIDFRSPFTATHTTGLATVAVALAERLEFDEEHQKLLKLAAYLHDLGKLAVPLEILEKPGRFTDDEWHVMRSHVYYTYHALAPIPELDVLTSWSALHQERLDGSGYPFAYTAERIPLEARVLAVADVFVGITEDRPYRKGMAEEEARNLLADMAAKRQIDPDVVRVVFDDFNTLNTIRAEGQEQAREAFQTFKQGLAAQV
ncbi:MAG: HD domain-containing protein [Candidatus Hydrogenedentota bacterium]